MNRAQQIIAEVEAKYEPRWLELVARFHAAKHPDSISARRQRERAEYEHHKDLNRD